MHNLRCFMWDELRLSRDLDRLCMGNTSYKHNSFWQQQEKKRYCGLHAYCNGRAQLFTVAMSPDTRLLVCVYCTRFWGDENDWITRMISSVDKAGQFYSLNCFHVQSPPSTAILWAGTPMCACTLCTHLQNWLINRLGNCSWALNWVGYFVLPLHFITLS